MSLSSTAFKFVCMRISVMQRHRIIVVLWIIIVDKLLKYTEVDARVDAICIYDGKQRHFFLGQ